MGFFFKLVFHNLKSKRFFIALGIILVTMMFSWTAFLDDSFEHSYMEAFLHGCFGYKSLFYGLAPLIAAIPFAAQHVENSKSGTIKYIVSRLGETRYFNTMFFANVLLTAITFMIGMAVFSLISFCAFSKNVDIDVCNAAFPNPYMQAANNSLLLYVITLIAHCSFVSVAFSSIGLAVSFFIRNKFVAWISAFIISILMGLFALFLNLVKFEPMAIFNVCRASGTTVFLVIGYSVAITGFSYLLARTKFRMVMRKDEEA